MPDGGAVPLMHHSSTMTVTNCTFEGNRASEDWGGAIFTRYSELKVFNTTFSGNSAGSEGGAIESWVGNARNRQQHDFRQLVERRGRRHLQRWGAEHHQLHDFRKPGRRRWGRIGHWRRTLELPGLPIQVLNNTILAGNVRGSAETENEKPDDIDGTVDPASRHNLIGDAATAGGLVHGINGNIVGNKGEGTIDITTVLDPNLADNGGPTKTHALVPGGPAVNAGDNTRAVGEYDQRGQGFARIYAGTVDIGAFEVQPQILSVEIDVKPGSDPNSIHLASNGVITVAIFTTDDFDASLVDASTVVFAGASAVRGALEDVDGDGDLDMVLHFRVQDTNLADIYAQLLAEDMKDGVLDSNHQTASISLTGQTATDEYFAGFDDVDLFLSGKNLRDFLKGLAAAGLI